MRTAHYQSYRIPLAARTYERTRYMRPMEKREKNKKKREKTKKKRKKKVEHAQYSILHIQPFFYKKLKNVSCEYYHLKKKKNVAKKMKTDESHMRTAT